MEKIRAYFSNLFLHTSGQDSFQHHYACINYRFLRDYMMEKNGQESLDEKNSLLLWIYCTGAAHLMADWFLGRVQTGDSQIAEICFQGLPFSFD